MNRKDKDVTEFGKVFELMGHALHGYCSQDSGLTVAEAHAQLNYAYARLERWRKEEHLKADLHAIDGGKK